MTRLGSHSVGGAADDDGDKNRKEDKKPETFPNSNPGLAQSNPLNISQPEIEDFSAAFTDSFLDFDFINNWLGEENREISGNFDMDDVGGDQDYLVLPEGESVASQPKENTIVGGVTNGDEMVSEKANIELGLRVVGTDQESRDLSSFVEEHLGRVSLNGVSNVERVESHGNNSVSHGAESLRLRDTVGNNGTSLKNEAATDSSSSSSSASSSSESEDDEEGDCKGIIRGKKVKNKEADTEKTSDAEEGEIILSDDADEMVAWSDDEDGDGNAFSGPIRSQNEIQVLPPVPSVDVSLQPHHQTHPVGTILSVIGAQVIVEGAEKHDPLNEGSILWITETRSPLGIVDEIFGPVKNPYYIVRYNSEGEVPSDVQQGTLVSYVPEFASHVLGDENLYKKGYDASNEYDEELSGDDEFSDDEKEAEHRKMLKMKKRGTSQNERNQRRNPNKTWKQNQDPEARTSQDQERSSSSSSGFGNNHTGNNRPMFPQTPQQAQTHFSAAPNGNWQPPPPLPPQGLNIPSGAPPNVMQQNPSFPLHQMPPQMNPMFPGLPLNFNPQLNFGNFSQFPPWNTGIDPNLISLLQLQIGLQAQNSSMSSLPLGGGQRVQSQGGQNGQNTQGSPEILPPNFNQGRGGGGGRRGGMHHRGRGRGRAWNHR